MPAGNIVYNPSSSTHSSVKKTKTNSKGPIYARVIKKSNKVTPPKKGITRRGGPGRGPLKRKPTKKKSNKSSNKSSNTVYKSLNLPQKSVYKMHKRPNSVTYATLRFPNQRNTRSSNREIVIKENVIGVMEQVRNAKKTRELSKNEAQKLVNRAMESK